MNINTGATVLRFLDYFDTIQPAIATGSEVLVTGILEKIKNGLTKSFYIANKINIDIFLARLKERAEELHLDKSHKFFEIFKQLEEIINPPPVEETRNFDLKPLKINQNIYMAFAQKEREKYLKKGETQSIS